VGTNRKLTPLINLPVGTADCAGHHEAKVPLTSDGQIPIEIVSPTATDTALTPADVLQFDTVVAGVHAREVTTPFLYTAKAYCDGLVVPLDMMTWSMSSVPAAGMIMDCTYSFAE
jgi:hypothetical protein